MHQERSRDSIDGIIHKSQASKKSISNSTRESEIETKNEKSPSIELEAPITIASIIGEYGPYQLSLTLLAFVRYTCVAMMTNTGPLIAPTLDYRCEIPSNLIQSLAKNESQTLDNFLLNKCNLALKNGTSYDCNSWIYDTGNTGVTLTDTFNLVCERDWLRSASQSAISIGVVVSSVILGSFSDRHGRSATIKVCFIGSLICGLISYVADNFLIYVVSRSLCSFSDLGLVVSLTTIIVETLGNKYRGAVCIIVYTGWACGVMIMPWLIDYFRNFRHLMLFTVCCHIFTLPWLMTTNESIRWLLINSRIEAAGDELNRINKWNRCEKNGTVEKFNKLKNKYIILAKRRKDLADPANNSILTKVNQLFQSKSLMLTTITVIWITFNSELLYMLFILINSDIGDDVKLNYAIGGIMETLATWISIVIISKLARKASLIYTLLCIAFLCFILSLTHQMPSASIWILNLTKLAISTLSSLIYVVTTEVFPTNLRQTGFGLCGTIGSLGAVVAPFIRTELVDMIGMSKVLLLVLLLPLMAALVIPSSLRETKGVELSDDVDDIEGEEMANDVKPVDS